MILTALFTAVCVIFFALFAIPFLIHLLNQDRDSKYGGIYTVESPYYKIKYYLFLLFLKIRKYRKHSKPSPLFDLDEKRHYKSIEKPQPLDSEYAIDSVYFFCTGEMNFRESDDKQKFDIILRIARRKNRISEFWLALKMDEGQTLVQTNYPETTISNCSRTGWKSVSGLSVYCDRPNEKWTIKYNGWLIEDTKERKPVHVNIRLCFRSFTNIIDSHKDTSEELTSDCISRERWTRDFFQNLKNLSEKSQTHYEQWGSYDGTITLDKNVVYEIEHGKGYRDHSFGIRNWNQYQRYGVLFGYLKNGGCFSLGSVCCRQTLSHVRYGYYITPFGDMRPITHHNLNLWKTFLCSPPQTKLNIEFFAGEKFSLEAEQTSEINFNLNKGKTIIIERFINIKLNGVDGKGVNEFCASDAIPRYKSPELHSIDVLDKKFVETSNEFCLSLKSVECRNRKVSGGKGCQLADLVKLQTRFKEIKVPPAFVVTTKAYNAFINANESIVASINALVDSMKNTKQSSAETFCQDILNKFEDGKIPQKVQDKIILNLLETFGSNWPTQSFAIRSSSAEEDGSCSSSAGQMSTFLAVKGLENILEKLKKCWASNFDHTAVSYRIRNGQSLKSEMGVVIMAMVPSHTSGVLFTVNPFNGDSTTMLINATFGLAEAIVSGECDPDQYEIEKSIDGSLKIIVKHVGNKNTLVKMNSNQDNVEKIEGKELKELCLSDLDILRLGKLGILIEKSYGKPCDIEWTESEGQILILQTRPITNLDTETDMELVREFDSGLSYNEECLTTSNIGEMMPSATTPLTLSLFASAVDKTFQVSSVQFGLISRFLYPRRYLASYSNHLFINLHCTALLSEIDKLEMLFIAILGRLVEKPTKLDILNFTGPRSPFRRVYMNLKKLLTLKDGKKNTVEWEKKFQCGYKIQPQKTSTLQMQAILNQIKDYYICWYDTVHNTASSVLWTMIMMKIVENNKGWSTNIYSKIATLLLTCSNIISADVPNALKQISIIIGKDEELKNFILSESDKSCLNFLNSTKSKEAGRLFQEFLNKHGHRCIREAEFQELSWRRAPEKVVSVIKSMVSHLVENDYIVKKDLSPEDAINSLHLNFGFIRRKLLKWVLLKAREGVSLREWGKSISIEMCDAFKEAFLKLGELMANENMIPERDLIYYFTFDELVSIMVDKTLTLSNILNKIQRRRRIHEIQMKINMPELCFGRPYESTKEDLNSEKSNQTKLVGFPVSVGRVSGHCRVISTLQEAAEIKPGEILIAPYTDIGWTPYFPLLSGLVTEKGSLLSHGAVVAREYGLPCLVGCKGATQIFQTGNHIFLNASEGTVELCNT